LFKNFLFSQNKHKIYLIEKYLDFTEKIFPTYNYITSKNSIDSLTAELPIYINFCDKSNGFHHLLWMDELLDKCFHFGSRQTNKLYMV